MSLRERKKQSTRRALVGAAARLFTEQGYAATTVSQIAAAAEVSTKTLFNYFPGKEDILFAGDFLRLDSALRVITERHPEEQPADLLQRLATEQLKLFTPLDDGTDEVSGVPHSLRLRLITTVPELQARALHYYQDAQIRLTHALHRVYPDELDLITAAGMIGSLLGAAQNCRRVSLERGDTPEQVVAATRRGGDVAMLGIQTAMTG